MKRQILFSSLIGLALLLSACGSYAAPANSYSSPTTVPAAADTSVPAAVNTTVPAQSSTSPASLAVGQDTTLGSFLTDASGMTLYLYTSDSPGTSTCEGGCATAWPPLLTGGAPIAGTGVDAAMLGTLTRSDGTTQVTYNSWPLYYYAKDAKAGDTKGEGVGGIWYVITPAGSQK